MLLKSAFFKHWLLSSLLSCCAMPQSVNQFLPPFCLDVIYMPLPPSKVFSVFFLFQNGPDLELCYIDALRHLNLSQYVTESVLLCVFNCIEVWDEIDKL